MTTRKPAAGIVSMVDFDVPFKALITAEAMYNSSPQLVGIMGIKERKVRVIGAVVTEKGQLYFRVDAQPTIKGVIPKVLVSSAEIFEEDRRIAKQQLVQHGLAGFVPSLES